MEVSLKWLRDYVDLVVPPDELARLLTMSGTEVETTTRIGASWENVYVAQVTSLAAHPSADRLQIVTVDYGQGRTRTVVAGAFNIKVGDKVPLALPGAKLLDGHSVEPREIVLKPVKLRGVLSDGMVCSAKELGLSEEHAGILVLDPDLKVGRLLAEQIGDVIFGLKVTPNRPDCLSMLGVAREVAALTGQRVRVPSTEYVAEGPDVRSLAAIEIADPDLCARYSASVIQGVRIGPSPRWLQQRLTAAGVRPINNVVDVTNYVMLEWNQPLHAFDYERIRGKRIIVRRAGDGETITTLDGVDRTLDHERLAITDEEGPVAVAGVMGGGASEVSDGTTSILLESANFDRISIRRTARSLRLPSEASRRFERGLPPEQTAPALERATQLVLQLAGGTAARGILDVYPRPADATRIRLTTAEVQRILGLQLDLDQMREALGRLGFACAEEASALLVTVPTWRLDVTLPADLVEELARMIGYEQLPATLPGGRPPEVRPNPAWEWARLIRETMAGCGYTEVIAYTLTSRQRLGRLHTASGPSSGTDAASAGPVAAAEPEGPLAAAVSERLVPLNLEPVRVVNPLSSDLECMRTTAFGSLLELLGQNLRRADRDVMLFELGKIYLPRPSDLPEERRVLTAVTGAYRSGRSWGSREELDFFDIKGAAETILDRMGVESVAYVPVTHPEFHPSRVAAITLVTADGPDQVIGVLGEVAEDVRAAFDVGERAHLLGLDLDRLTAAATRVKAYEPIPRFPAVIQDVAVVLPAGVPSNEVAGAIRRAGEPLVRSVELFDVFQGGAIASGKRSLAYHITYQSTDRTLTDADVAAVHRQIERALVVQLGGELRV